MLPTLSSARKWSWPLLKGSLYKSEYFLQNLFLKNNLNGNIVESHKFCRYVRRPLFFGHVYLLLSIMTLFPACCNTLESLPCC